jgi:hypothetical protein
MEKVANLMNAHFVSLGRIPRRHYTYHSVYRRYRDYLRPLWERETELEVDLAALVLLNTPLGSLEVIVVNELQPREIQTRAAGQPREISQLKERANEHLKK